jgi:hypothetical protein
MLSGEQNARHIRAGFGIHDGQRHAGGGPTPELLQKDVARVRGVIEPASRVAFHQDFGVFVGAGMCASVATGSQP